MTVHSRSSAKDLHFHPLSEGEDGYNAAPLKGNGMNIDLSAMSLKELKSLQSDVAKAIADFDGRRKRDAMAQLEAKARELGFGLSELLGGVPTKKTRAPANAKYAHPENRDLTWSGRGRKPQWFADALAAGKSPEDLAI